MLQRSRIQGFGKSCLISLHESSSDAEELTELSARELRRLEARFSAYHPDSIVSEINRAAGTEYVVPLDAEARSLFKFATALWQETSRVYDPTIGILNNCYTEDGRLRATPGQISDLLRLVGWSKLKLDEQGARLEHVGMSLDLDTFIRAYTLDNIRKLLVAEGVQHACIEMEHDATSIGKQADGSNWLFGVRLPHGSRSAINRIKINGKSLALRGDFDHTIAYQGETFGRALSPIDGYPVPGMLCVGVIADTCLAACSAATVARLKTEQAGIRWLQGLEMPWIGIGRDLTCHGPLST